MTQRNLVKRLSLVVALAYTLVFNGRFAIADDKVDEELLKLRGSTVTITLTNGKTYTSAAITDVRSADGRVVSFRIQSVENGRKKLRSVGRKFIASMQVDATGVVIQVSNAQSDGGTTNSGQSLLSPFSGVPWKTAPGQIVTVTLLNGHIYKNVRIKEAVFQADGSVDEFWIEWRTPSIDGFEVNDRYQLTTVLVGHMREITFSKSRRKFSRGAHVDEEAMVDAMGLHPFESWTTRSRKPLLTDIPRHAVAGEVALVVVKGQLRYAYVRDLVAGENGTPLLGLSAMARESVVHWFDAEDSPPGGVLRTCRYSIHPTEGAVEHRHQVHIREDGVVVQLKNHSFGGDRKEYKPGSVAMVIPSILYHSNGTFRIFANATPLAPGSVFYYRNATTRRPLFVAFYDAEAQNFRYHRLMRISRARSYEDRDGVAAGIHYFSGQSEGLRRKSLGAGPHIFGVSGIASLLDILPDGRVLFRSKKKYDTHLIMGSEGHSNPNSPLKNADCSWS